MNEIKFNHHDAWILMTIPTNNEGINLEEIIGIADSINHTIPSDEEIEDAITKSLQTGILVTKNDKFIFNENFRLLLENLIDNSKTKFDLWDNLENYLTNNSWQKLYENIYKLNPIESAKAYKSYSKKFWKTYKNKKDI